MADTMMAYRRLARATGAKLRGGLVGRMSRHERVATQRRNG